MDHPPATPAPLFERTYRLLKAMIADGRIKPGERLIESRISRAFTIGRSPARGALGRLLAEQLIESDGRRGFRVTGRQGGAGAGSARDAQARPPHDPLATLEPIRVTAPPRRWEALYDEVEQELLVQLLYRSVRINELQLARQFGVSRTVTRDLLARMDVYGLIHKDPAGHWCAPQITPNRIRHLYELRRLLEPAALRDAVAVMPPAVARQARQHVLAMMARPLVDSVEFDVMEKDLHVRMLAYCRNPEVLRALACTHVLFAPTRHLLHPILQIPAEMIRASLREHLQIIDCVLAGDVDAAELGLRAHLFDAVDRWLARFAMTGSVAGLSMPRYLMALADAPGDS